MLTEEYDNFWSVKKMMQIQTKWKNLPKSNFFFLPSFFLNFFSVKKKKFVWKSEL